MGNIPTYGVFIKKHIFHKNSHKIQLILNKLNKHIIILICMIQNLKQ